MSGLSASIRSSSSDKRSIVSVISFSNDSQISTISGGRADLNELENAISTVFFIALLDETIDQIQVLTGGIQPDKRLSSYMQCLEDRAVEFHAEYPLIEAEIMENVENVHERNRKKCKNDSAQIGDFLSTEQTELKETLQFRFSQTIIDTLLHNEIEEAELLIEVEKNRIKLNNLKELFLTESNDNQRKINDSLQKLATVKDETQVLQFENVLFERYIHNWENARNQQNLIKNKKSEESFLKVMREYREKTEKELRINSEIELYVLNNKKFMEDQIDVWKDKLESDVEVRNLDIAVIKEKWEELGKLHKDLQELYAQHKKEIEDYLAEKEKKKSAKERMVLLNTMARRIQNWWRKILAKRNHLELKNTKKRKQGNKEKKRKRQY